MTDASRKNETGEAYLRPLNLQQAADWAGVHYNTIAKACRQGELGTKIGMQWAIGQRELARWVYGRNADAERVA